MAERIRLTRRFPAQMTETAYRRLRAFAAQADLSEAEAMSFVFENIDGITDEATVKHRLMQFKSRLSTQTRTQS
jgi:hypothetical protein